MVCRACGEPKRSQLAFCTSNNWTRQNPVLAGVLHVAEQRHDVQVLRMLRGQQDPGPAFHLNKKEGRFSVAPQTHVAHLSQGSLHHLLHTFASVGTDLLR